MNLFLLSAHDANYAPKAKSTLDHVNGMNEELNIVLGLSPLLQEFSLHSLVNNNFPPGAIELNFQDHAQLELVGVYVEGTNQYDYSTEETLGRKNISCKRHNIEKEVMAISKTDQCYYSSKLTWYFLKARQLILN
jgi:hypothetical protein